MRAQAPDRDGVRKTRWVAVRNTYPDLLGTTAKDWLDMFEHLGKFTKGSLEPPTHKLNFELEDGTRVESELVFLALDREEHVRKLRGLQVTGAWPNEVKELPFAVISMLDLRIGRYPKEVAPRGTASSATRTPRTMTIGITGWPRRNAPKAGCSCASPAASSGTR
jgi:hypothetical protein